jgi:hypothetical protein
MHQDGTSYQSYIVPKRIYAIVCCRDSLAIIFRAGVTLATKILTISIDLAFSLGPSPKSSIILVQDVF